MIFLIKTDKRKFDDDGDKSVKRSKLSESNGKYFTHYV